DDQEEEQMQEKQTNTFKDIEEAQKMKIIQEIIKMIFNRSRILDKIMIDSRGLPSILSNNFDTFVDLSSYSSSSNNDNGSSSGLSKLSDLTCIGEFYKGTMLSNLSKISRNINRICVAD